jgi:hypothetical protein
VELLRANFGLFSSGCRKRSSDCFRDDSSERYQLVVHTISKHYLAIAILCSDRDGRYGLPKSNEGVKEKEEKVDDEEDEEEQKHAKVKEVEEELTEKFKMALRITASKSLRKQIVRRAGHYPLQTTSSVKHSLRRNRVAISNSQGI